MRTALFNWLYARRHAGEFVLRIDDTDVARIQEDRVAEIEQDLLWLGLSWDERYRQSERLRLYNKAAQDMLDLGAAYYCYCTPDELDQRRRRALELGRPPGYDGHCFELSEAKRRAFENEGRPRAIRFHMPDDGEAAFDDLIKGRLAKRNLELSDFVIVRAGELPTYQLASTYDDGSLGITHVIRGDDLLEATFRQLEISRVMGFDPPVYAHVPLIVGPDRAPLSKRHGAVAIADFRSDGYLPEALVNYLSLLGWSPGEQEVFDLSELANRFDIKAVSVNPAAFDPVKLSWLSGEHIRRLTVEDLAMRLEAPLAAAGVIDIAPTPHQRQILLKVTPLIQTRLERLVEAAPLVRFFFHDVQVDSSIAAKVFASKEALTFLDLARKRLAELAVWDTTKIEDVLRGLQQEQGIKPKIAFQPLRAAVTGVLISPPLFESLAILGKDLSIERVIRALQTHAGKN